MPAGRQGNLFNRLSQLSRSLHALRLVGMTIILSLFIATNPTVAKAENNFTTDYHIVYSPLENELTRATLKVTLTNTTTQFYASSYKMQLGFTDVTNLTASDPEGPLKPVITRTNEGYMLDLTFNKKAVGQGDSLTFTINFDTKEVARKHGKIWELNVPGIANPEEFRSFVVDVKVPPSFGKPTYIKPHQVNGDTLTFTKGQLGKSGISIAFGDSQLYAFGVMYHLQNKNLFPVKSEVALPSSNNYQDVYISGMEPTPDNVRVDRDGNWIAEFTLMPTAQIDVDVRGNVAVKLKPETEELSLNDYAFYTREQKYWETSDPKIQELAQKLKTPRAIYDYVITTLKYDFSRVGQTTTRLGAAEALKNPDAAVCREFTDLFIAIARAAGIPAREVDGFAYTENPRQRPISVSQDILHVWPQYYDKEKKTWVMIDPTWGSTTGGVDYFTMLDNDHVAFVTKGVSSIAPLPAGAYKLGSGNGLKDVAISFAENVPHADPEVMLEPVLPSTAVAGFPVKGKVIVKNTGSSLVPSQLFTVNSPDLTPHDQVYQFPAVPPFGTVDVPVAFHATSFLTNADTRLTIRYNPNPVEPTAGQAVLGASTSDKDVSVVSRDMKVAPFFMTVWGIGGFIAVFTLIILIVAAKSGRLPLFRKK